MIVLLGALVVVLGFATRRNPLLVVRSTGIAAGGAGEGECVCGRVARAGELVFGTEVLVCLAT
jgi:uncharacterized membrane protein